MEDIEGRHGQKWMNKRMQRCIRRKRKKWKKQGRMEKEGNQLTGQAREEELGGGLRDLLSSHVSGDREVGHTITIAPTVPQTATINE